MKRKEPEHLEAGMYVYAVIPSTGAEVFTTVVHTNPTSICNTIRRNGDFFIGDIKDLAVYEMTKEERRFYFDTIASCDTTPCPHYDGDEDHIECGEVMVTAEGDVACVMGTTIKVPQETSNAITMWHINLKKHEFSGEEIYNRKLFRANEEQQKLYWQIFYEYLEEKYKNNK